MWKKTSTSLILICCVVLVVAVLGKLYWPQINTALRDLEPTCTIGHTGSTVTLTIQAWSASDDCNKIAHGQASFLSGPDPAAYQVNQASGPIVCELDIQGRHLIVRDQGLLGLEGLAECQFLKQRTS